MRRVLITLVACLGLAGPAVVATSTAASAAPAPATAGQTATAEASARCASGYVCIFQGDVHDGGSNHPMMYSFYKYGTYNVHNLIGEYTVFNCQTGGAGAEGFTGYDGTGSVAWALDTDNCAEGLWTDLTSTYSVRLYP